MHDVASSAYIALEVQTARDALRDHKLSDREMRFTLEVVSLIAENQYSKEFQERTINTLLLGIQNSQDLKEALARVFMLSSPRASSWMLSSGSKEGLNAAIRNLYLETDSIEEIVFNPSFDKEIFQSILIHASGSHKFWAALFKEIGERYLTAENILKVIEYGHRREFVIIYFARALHPEYNYLPDSWLIKLVSSLYGVVVNETS